MRTLLLPVLLAAGIGLPFLISTSQKTGPPLQNHNAANRPFPGQANYGIPAHQASTGYAQPPTQFASFPNGANGQFVGNQTVPPGLPGQFASTPVPPAPVPPAILNPPPGGIVILPGTANGPDLTAAPMEFMPISNLSEVFRFDVSPNWVKSRWTRVSTAPTEPGLHGMRVALNTGTNVNDVTGSLTYYFDANQRLQRISFQGWVGDTARLVELMTQTFGLRSQPTHFAGLYVSSNRRGPTGALIMRHPDVVRAENPNQQVAVVLEVNNSQGNFPISQNMQQMLNSAGNNR